MEWLEELIKTVVVGDNNNKKDKPKQFSSHLFLILITNEVFLFGKNLKASCWSVLYCLIYV